MLSIGSGTVRDHDRVMTEWQGRFGISPHATCCYQLRAVKILKLHSECCSGPTPDDVPPPQCAAQGSAALVLMHDPGWNSSPYDVSPS